MNDLGKLLAEGNGKGNSAIWIWVVAHLILAVCSFVGAIWLQNMQNDLIAKSGASIGALIHKAELQKAIVQINYAKIILIVMGVFCGIDALFIGRAISKTEIKVYEGGIVGKGMSKWFYIGDTRTFDFMLTYSQASVDLNGGQIVVHGPETRYYIYVKNGREIQEAIFKQKT